MQINLESKDFLLKINSIYKKFQILCILKKVPKNLKQNAYYRASVHLPIKLKNRIIDLMMKLNGVQEETRIQVKEIKEELKAVQNRVNLHNANLLNRS